MGHDYRIGPFYTGVIRLGPVGRRARNASREPGLLHLPMPTWRFPAIVRTDLHIVGNRRVRRETKETERNVSDMMERVVVQARHGMVILVIALLVGTLTLASCGTGQPTGTTAPSASPATLSERLEEGGRDLDRAIAAMQGGDMVTVTLAYQDFNVIWIQIEDRVWKQSRDSQIALQMAIDNVDNELLRPGVTPDEERTIQALQHLRQVVNEQEVKLRSS